MIVKNILSDLPSAQKAEIFEKLIEKDDIKIERIVSKGQTTDWQTQDHNEWVMILVGEAEVEFFGIQEKHQMESGDYLLIPAQQKHRVSWTTPHEETIWLALHY